MALISLLRWLSDECFIHAEKLLDTASFFCNKGEEEIDNESFGLFLFLSKVSFFLAEILYKCGLFAHRQAVLMYKK